MALSVEELLILRLAQKVIPILWNWEPIGYAERLGEVAWQAYQTALSQVQGIFTPGGPVNPIWTLVRCYQGYAFRDCVS